MNVSPSASNRTAIGPTFDLECEAGVPCVAGVDEAGRGPLAGPVVAAAVVLDRSRVPAGIDDSKAVSYTHLTLPTILRV